MTRANVRVRPATADDVPALVDVLRTAELSSGNLAKTAADPRDDRLTARLREILADEDSVLLVAADEAGAAAGVLIARHDTVGAIDTTRVLHVTQLLVAPGHRRRGTGRSLLAAAVHIADEAGVEHVLASVTAGSREGNRYLARIGFAPLVVHRIAPTATLRKSLGMTDVAGRMAVLRRARLVRAQRSGFAAAAARPADTA